jgi:hypothetical protein
MRNLAQAGVPFFQKQTRGASPMSAALHSIKAREDIYNLFCVPAIARESDFSLLCVMQSVE